MRLNRYKKRNYAQEKSQALSECGYIAVETSGAFIPFVLLVVSILSLVNIITLQVRIHYAMTQTASALSMYCYVLEAAGVTDEMAAMDDRAEKFADTIESLMAGIEYLSENSEDAEDIDIDSGVDAMGRSFDAAQEIIADPAEMLRNLANFGLSELRDIAAVKITEPLFGRYLTNGKQTVEEYFTSSRITGFEFVECAILKGNDDIKLTACYEVEYTFWALRLPFSPTLKITQTVVTKAWLGGSGEGYKG